MLLFISLKR
ncbi:hypothetical protein vseg_010206 [Gypsophila vaccaria]